MKKIFFINGLLIALGLAVLPGCKKVLDTKPITEIDASDVDNPNSNASITADQAEQLIAGVYNYLFDGAQEYMVFDRVVNGDAISDNSYAGSDNLDNHELDKFTTSSLNNNVRRDWQYLYQGIGKINEAIDKVQKCTDPALSPARKNQIIAEAKTLRAFNYFELVRLWGDVPLMLKPINTTNTQTIFASVSVARTPVQAVYDTLIADLEFALQHVRDVNEAPNKEIVSKGLVNTLLAHIYATKKPVDWNKVKQYADAVIPNYSLLTNYDFLFDGTHENSSEAIWEINYDGWGTGNNRGNWVVYMYIGGGWRKFNPPSNDLVKAFQAEGDNVRLNSSIQFVDYSGQWVDEYWPMNNLPILNKIRDFGGASNFIVYRLPDILLLKAEALNELGDLAGARNLVNQVRTRVSLPNTPANDQAGMRLAIEKERRLELAFEGHRWFDLLRTGRAVDVMQNVKDGNNKPLNYNIKEFRLLWPVPQVELDRNPALSQNPGY